ncbi:fatty acid elongase [Trypanosoma theileri]|uniref:Elongation of fatty acids protein n=1 Tax=Trypanosoma theileri TaxID=67003 RepID=A0A1X0NP89_9TRYP|nr:fatty acid elongase [Trypanosoma theileri]ORC86303.1 fatty acid elongase [Trypanosoma theileri]
MIAQLTELGHDFKGTPALQWMREHTEVPILAVVFYLAFVLFVPNTIMAHRPPIKMRLWNILWNLVRTVFAVGGTYYCVPQLMEWCTASLIPNLLPRHLRDPQPIVEGSFYTSMCYWNKGMFLDGTAAMWLLLINLLNLSELINTVFLVFQKKPVNFLHWYYHATVLLFCWHAYVTQTSSGLWFAALNYSVHSILYLYDFLFACGLGKVIRPIAPVISALKILQVLAGTFIVVYTAVQRAVHPNGCDTANSSILIGLLIYGSYLLLFFRFFLLRLSPHRIFLKSRKSKRRKPLVLQSMVGVVDGENLFEMDAKHGLRKYV